MNLRNLGVLILAIAGLAILLAPGAGLIAPAMWFGPPRAAMLISMAAVIFCVVYFGTLKFWQLLTGDKLEKPLPEILALFLFVRLIVDCARVLMWW
jgi:hypothetical protein